MAGLGLELGRTMKPGAHINMAFFLIRIHDLDLEHVQHWFSLLAVDVSSVSSLLEIFPWQAFIFRIQHLSLSFSIICIDLYSYSNTLLALLQYASTQFQVSGSGRLHQRKPEFIGGCFVYIRTISAYG